MPQPDPDNWTQSDAVKLRTYLVSHPKFLRALNRRRPKIEGNTVEARAVTGSDLNGFLTAIDEIEALMQDPSAGVDNPGYIPTGGEEQQQEESE